MSTHKKQNSLLTSDHFVVMMVTGGGPASAAGPSRTIPRAPGLVGDGRWARARNPAPAAS